MSLQRLKHRRVFYAVIVIALLFISFEAGQAANDSPQTFTLQGELTNEAGTAPLTDSDVTLTVGIYNPAADCLLYEESQSGIDLGDTAGLFSIQVGSNLGSNKRVSGRDPGLTMAQVFSNNTSNVTAPGPYCLAGYTPSPGHVRLLRLTIQSTSLGTVTLSPDQTIGAVPQALVAQTLQGLDQTQFIRVNSSAQLSQANAETLTNGGDASNLHHHNSTYISQGTGGTQNIGSGTFYSSGSLGLGVNSAPSSTQLAVTATTSNNKGVVIQGATNQLANLFEVNNSGGSTLVSIDKNGNFSLGPNQTFGLGTFASTPASCTQAGAIWYSNNSLQYCDNSFTVQTLGTAAGSVTNVTGASPISSSGGTAPQISISQSSTNTNGYLSSTDWNTFNGKVGGGSNLTTLGAIPQVSASGVLSQTPGLTCSVAANISQCTFVAGGSQSVNPMTQWLNNAQSSILYAINASGTASNSYDLVNKGDVSATVSATLSNYLPIAGGTMTGPLNINTAPRPDNAAQETIATGADSKKGLVIQGNSGSQSGNLLEWQNSGGSVMSYVDSAGKFQTNQLRLKNLPTNDTDYVGFKAPNSISSSQIWSLPSADGTSGQVLSTDGGGNLSWVANTAGAVTSVSGASPISSSGGTTPQISISQSTTSADGYLSSTDWNTFNGKVGGASNLTTAGALPRVLSSGVVTQASGFSLNTSANVTQLNLTKGSSQSTNPLTRWLDTDGSTQLYSVNPSGAASNSYDVMNKGDVSSLITSNLASYLPLAGGTLTGALKINTASTADSLAQQLIATGATTNKGLVVQGASSQTANLQEWQSSAGSVLASVTSSGVFSGSGASLNSLNGSNISSGTISDSVLSSNVCFLNAGNSFSGANTFSNSSGALSLLPHSGVAGATGSLRFRELSANGTNYVAFKAPDSIASDITFILPSADGSNGQVLSTNGSGTLSWGSAGTGTVTSVSGTAPVSVATGTSTPVISMAAATSSVDGYLTSSDWTTFNNKLNASGGTLTGTLTINGNNNLTMNSGGIGTFTTGTGAVTLNGATTVNSSLSIAANNTFSQSGSGTFSTGTGTVSLNGAVSIAANKSITMNSGTGTFAQTYSGTGPAFSITNTAASSGNILNLTTTATGAANNDKALNISVSGANANSTRTRYGSYSSVTASGTSSTNVAGYFEATSATNNYALVTNGGNVGIGVTTPTSLLQVAGTFSQTGANTFSTGTGAVSLNGSTTLAANSDFTMSSGTGIHTQTYTGTADACTITANSTTAANNAKAINVSVTGANGSAGVTRYGAYSSVTATGGTSTNVAGYFAASSGTNNYALVTNGGNVGIGTTSPTSLLHVAGNANVTGSLTTKQVVGTASSIASGPGITIDLSLGSYFYVTINQNTTINFPSNVASSGSVSEFILEIINGGSATTSFPAQFKWPGGTAPSLTASGTDIVRCVTRDGGSNFRCRADLDVK